MTEPGLGDVVAAESRLSHIDGENGRFELRGIPVEELASEARFEESVFLLWNDRLPDGEELDRLRADLASRRSLDEATLDQLRIAARSAVPVVDALGLAVSTMVVDDGDPREQARTLVARIPTAVAAYWRLASGREPVEPRTELSHVANYLAMLEGSTPEDARVDALETYLNTVVDHGLNASAFAARIVASTDADLASAVTAALCSFKGSLHGGGPAVALDMLESFAAVDDLETHLTDRFESGRAGSYLNEAVPTEDRLIGFGHRVYETHDPRAEVLASALDAFAAAGYQARHVEIARRTARLATDLLDQYESEPNAFANLGFYTPVLLDALGLPSELFMPTFAVSRVGGWTAHALEQRATGRLSRPHAEYVGRHSGEWIPIDDRQ